MLKKSALTPAIAPCASARLETGCRSVAEAPCSRLTETCGSLRSTETRWPCTAPAEAVRLKSW
jgi:hypothetical protein